MDRRVDWSMSRRHLLAGPAALLAAGLVAACGGGRRKAAKDGSTPTDPVGPADTTATYPINVPRVPADAAAGVPGWPTTPSGAQLVQGPP